MRISDWSSDVCSSDLSPLYAATETQIARILGRFGGKWIDFPAGASREEIDSAHGKAAAQEIGRATCRERGCRDVQILEGGVALKEQIGYSTITTSVCY